MEGPLKDKKQIKNDNSSKKSNKKSGSKSTKSQKRNKSKNGSTYDLNQILDILNFLNEQEMAPDKIEIKKNKLLVTFPGNINLKQVLNERKQPIETENNIEESRPDPVQRSESREDQDYKSTSSSYTSSFDKNDEKNNIKKEKTTGTDEEGDEQEVDSPKLESDVKTPSAVMPREEKKEKIERVKNVEEKQEEENTQGSNDDKEANSDENREGEGNGDRGENREGEGNRDEARQENASGNRDQNRERDPNDQRRESSQRDDDVDIDEQSQKEIFKIIGEKFPKINSVVKKVHKKLKLENSTAEKFLTKIGYDKILESKDNLKKLIKMTKIKNFFKKYFSKDEKLVKSLKKIHKKQPLLVTYFNHIFADSDIWNSTFNITREDPLERLFEKCYFNPKDKASVKGKSRPV